MTAYFYGNPGGGNGRVPREKKGRMLQEGKQHETEKNSQGKKTKGIATAFVGD